MTPDQVVNTVLDVKTWMRKEDCDDAMDCVIDGLMSGFASEINNRGTDSQVRYMVKLGYTAKEIIDCMKEETGSE